MIASFADELTAALPLINTVGVIVLGFLHVKNASAIASTTTALIGDAGTATTGNILATLPKIITDAHAAGIAFERGMQAAPGAPSIGQPTIVATKETTPHA